jgi:antitoxin ParD1/3/4
MQMQQARLESSPSKFKLRHYQMFDSIVLLFCISLLHNGRAFFMSRRGRSWVRTDMPITLTPDQEAWLPRGDRRFRFGRRGGAPVARRIAERELEEDDLAWAKPLVDEGLAALERGEVMSLEEHKARNAARLAALKG